MIHLEYEAYTSMAETELKKICRDVRQKWPSVKHIAVHHRLGYVCPDPILLQLQLQSLWCMAVLTWLQNLQECLETIVQQTYL